MLEGPTFEEWVCLGALVAIGLICGAAYVLNSAVAFVKERVRR